MTKQANKQAKRNAASESNNKKFNPSKQASKE